MKSHQSPCSLPVITKVETVERKSQAGQATGNGRKRVVRKVERLEVGHSLLFCLSDTNKRLLDLHCIGPEAVVFQVSTSAAGDDIAMLAQRENPSESRYQNYSYFFPISP